MANIIPPLDLSLKKEIKDLVTESDRLYKTKAYGEEAIKNDNKAIENTKRADYLSEKFVSYLKHNYPDNYKIKEIEITPEQYNKLKQHEAEYNWNFDRSIFPKSLPGNVYIIRLKGKDEIIRIYYIWEDNKKLIMGTELSKNQPFTFMPQEFKDYLLDEGVTYNNIKSLYK